MGGGGGGQGVEDGWQSGWEMRRITGMKDNPRAGLGPGLGSGAISGAAPDKEILVGREGHQGPEVE